MSGPVQRPEFYEGQVLAAADLAGTVSYARNQLARHERFLHSYGIVSGLQLSLDSNQQLTISAGAAIDGTGREIIVGSATPITSVFNQTSSNPQDWFPVFLIGMDTVAPATSTLTGVCDDPQPSRTNEGAVFEFGNVGDEQTLADQQAPSDPTAGPGGDAADQNPWRLLVGYVQATGTTITAAQVAPTGKMSPRYAGVRADDVNARGTQLTLETSSGASGKPQLTIDENQGGELLFQLVGQQPPLLKVDASGNLTIKGQLTTGGPKPGDVLVESGVVSDGMVLPLPGGVTAQMVTDNKVRLYALLSAHPLGAVLPANTVAATVDCGFDPTTLVVSCRVRQLAAGVLATTDAPGTCDYIVAAAVITTG